MCLVYFSISFNNPLHKGNRFNFLVFFSIIVIYCFIVPSGFLTSFTLRLTTSLTLIPELRPV